MTQGWLAKRSVLLVLVNQSAAVIKTTCSMADPIGNYWNGDQNEFLFLRACPGAVALDYTVSESNTSSAVLITSFFVWALVLMLATRKLLIAITAFTLGHSLTITCGPVAIRVPQELTEFFIALSIFVLAVEAARHRLNPEANLWPKGLWRVIRSGSASYWSAARTGFAGGAAGNRISEEVLTALLMFNIGVELGIPFIGVVLGIGATMRTVAKQHFRS